MILKPAPLSWHNGKIIEREQAAPSVASHSLHLGIGVFDGIMAYWNNDHYYIHRLEAHLARMCDSSAKMGLEFFWTTTELASGLLSLLEAIPLRTYYIRPIVYRSVPQLNFNDTMPVDVTILAVEIERDVDKPLACHISNFERVSGRAIPINWKICGTYVNSYLSRRAAELAGFNDAILLDQEGRITEATAANIFFCQKDKIVTPKLNANIFPGITRATLLDIAEALQIEVIERDVKPKELENFDAAFIAATMLEVKPLSRIGHCQYDPVNHPVFKQLLTEFREITHQ